MKKFIIFVFIMFLSLPVFAQNDDKVMKSELGQVQNVQYEDVEQNYSDKSQVKQLVTVKLLTGEFKGQEFKTTNMITNNPYYDIFLHKGDKVILHSEMEDDGETVNYDIGETNNTTIIPIIMLKFFFLLLF